MQVAQRNLEIAYFNTGYYDRRVAELRDRLRVQADDRDARWELGRTYALLGQVDDAVAEFSRAARGTTRTTSARSSSSGSPRRASGDLETAQRWFARALDARPEQRGRAVLLGEVLYNRGLNDEALSALKRADRARRPTIPTRTTCSASSSGDMGRHDEAQKATKRAHPAQSGAVARAGQPLARPDTPQTYEAVVAGARHGRAHRRMAVRRTAQLAHFNLGLAFRQKGYYAEALREYRLAARARRGRGASCCRRWRRSTCCKKEPATAARAVRQAARDAAGQPEAVERARRRAAPGRPLRRRGRELRRARRRATRSTRSRSTTSASRSTTPATPTASVEAFRRALDGAAGVREGAAQPRAAAVQAEAAAAVPRGVSPGAAARARAAGGVERRRARARGAARSSRTRATRSAARSTRARTTPRRTTT